MTKREFDALTKHNASPDQPRRGGDLASDERWQYRTSRMRSHDGCGAYGPNAFSGQRDRLAERAAYRRANPSIPTLALGSKYRASTEWRLLGRFPRLPLKPQERAALEGPRLQRIYRLLKPLHLQETTG